MFKVKKCHGLAPGLGFCSSLRMAWCTWCLGCAMKRNIWWEEFGNNFGYSTNPCIRILVFLSIRILTTKRLWLFLCMETKAGLWREEAWWLHPSSLSWEQVLTKQGWNDRGTWTTLENFMSILLVIRFWHDLLSQWFPRRSTKAILIISTMPWIFLHKRWKIY